MRRIRGRLGPPSWPSILRSLGLLVHPTVMAPLVLGPVVALYPEEEEEGWERAVRRRLLAPEDVMPAMRSPRPRDAPPSSRPSVDTGQFSKRKTDKW